MKGIRLYWEGKAEDMETVPLIIIAVTDYGATILPMERPGSGATLLFTAKDFPEDQQLIVTTTRGVYAWTQHGVVEIFRSGSGGIVAAKKISNHSDLLAVADSEVVLLHNTKRGMQKSYRLKGNEGQIRLLQYAQESHTLFFTTTLQDSVQSYSIRQAKLLDPTQAHPSPPNVFALSATSDLLLSASQMPPTIHLTNLLLSPKTVLLQSKCSDSTVVAATFHPLRRTVFLLAFADGTLASYDAGRLFQPGGKEERNFATAGSGNDGELGHIKNLYATGSIAAVEFIPSFGSRAVSVGADGKCCIVEFSMSVKEGATLVMAWYAQGSATSLSILPRPPRERKEVAWDGNVKTTQDTVVAIGCADGRVLLFDFGGHLLGEKILGIERSRVIDVEWLARKGDGMNFDHGYLHSKFPSNRGIEIGLAANGTVSRSTAVDNEPLAIHPEKSDQLLNHVYKRSSSLSTSTFPVPKPERRSSAFSKRRSENNYETDARSSKRDDRSLHSGKHHATHLLVNRNPSSSKKYRRKGSGKVQARPIIQPQPAPRTGKRLANQCAQKARGKSFRNMDRLSSIKDKTQETIESLSDVPAHPNMQENRQIKHMNLADLDNSSSNRSIVYQKRGFKRHSRKGAIAISSHDKPIYFYKPPITSSLGRDPVFMPNIPLRTSEDSNDTIIDWSAGKQWLDTSNDISPLVSGLALEELPPSHKDTSTAGHHKVKEGISKDRPLIRSSRRFRFQEDFQDRAGYKFPSRRPSAPVSPNIQNVADMNATSQNMKFQVSMSPSKIPQPSKERHCPCIYYENIANTQTSMIGLLKSFQDKTMRQFQEQRKLIEKSMFEHGAWRLSLEEENRLLRQELARQRKHSPKNSYSILRG